PTFLKAMTLETGKTRDQLRELYSQSPEKLIQDMIRLNLEGGGGLSSLDEQARAATDGIGTSIDNMNNAITRAITSTIHEIGRENIVGAINAIGGAFEAAAKAVRRYIEAVRPLFSALGGLLNRLGIIRDTVEETKPPVESVDKALGNWTPSINSANDA